MVVSPSQSYPIDLPQESCGPSPGRGLFSSVRSGAVGGQLRLGGCLLGGLYLSRGPMGLRWQVIISRPLPPFPSLGGRQRTQQGHQENPGERRPVSLSAFNKP